MIDFDKGQLINKRNLIRMKAARFCSAGLICGAALGLAPSPGADIAEGPLRIGDRRQLFIDDRLVDVTGTRNTGHTMNPPVTIRRVMTPDMPWEALGFIFYCSVVDDGGTAKLFYGSYSHDTERRKHFNLALSEDGLHWRRAPVGLSDFGGSKDNNILPISAVEASVFLDPRAAPEKRYRLLFTRDWPNPMTAGVFAGTSADGMHWAIATDRLLPFLPDSQPSFFWDEGIGQYAVYLRAWNPGRAVARVAVDDLERPWPYDRSVPPRHHWGKDKIPTLSRELPTVMARDDRDPENLQLYTSAAMRYPFADGVYLAFPAAYLLFDGPDWTGRALHTNDGIFEVQMASGRDGVKWERWRQAYISPGFHDGTDLRLVSMGNGIIRRGRFLYQYFVGWPYTHGRPSHWEKDAADRAHWIKRNRGGIYCAMQRVDGFISMDAPYEGGTLLTRPLIFDGDRLCLNLHTAGSGIARVALLDENGGPLAGFTEADCEAINADDLDYEVRWKGGPDIGALAGKPVRVRIIMRNTKLYAMQFTKSPR